MDSWLKESWKIPKKYTSINMLLKSRENGGAFVANSIFLIVNSAAGSVLGFIFWVLAARLYSPQAVGIASAFTSAGGLLSFAATLGLGAGLMRYLPSIKSNRSDLINSCLLLVCLVALVTAVVFLVGTPYWAPASNLIREDFRLSLAFIIFVISSAMLSLLGNIYLALRRADFLLLQGFLVGFLKIVLVAALASYLNSFGILISWALAGMIVMGVGILLFLKNLEPGFSLTIPRWEAKSIMRFSIANYVSTLLWSFPGWVLPLIVVNRLGSETNAHFFVSWSLAALLFAIPTAISTSLFTEGSYQEQNFASHIKTSLKLISLLVLPAALMLILTGEKILLIFGHQYSQEGSNLIRILALSSLPLSLNQIIISISNVQKRLTDIIAITAGIAVGTLVISFALFSRVGILSPGIGWLVSQSLAAIILLPKLTRALKIGGR